MCVAIHRTHPACGHLQSTAGAATSIQHCTSAQQAAMAAFAGLLVPCSGKNLQQRNEAISRSYCDASIVAGVEGNKANGLDPDVQARNRSVRMGEIPRHHPGWTV
jgi:hypothetical protein